MKLIICGDFVSRNRVEKQLEQGDYSCLNQVSPIIKQADYAVVNFESPIVSHDVKPIFKAGPNISCHENAMACVKEAGFHCVTLANNHFRDYGEVGVNDTLGACKKYGINHVGGGKNIKEAEQVLYQSVADKILAIVNVCENEYSIATDKRGGSAPLNPVRNAYAIKEARKQADYVVVITHGGIEEYQYPTSRMVETYRFFVDMGADAILNHHQHCYSGYEVYQGKPIFYGLGNFCFDNNNLHDELKMQGYFVELDLDATIVSYKIYPYIQCGETPVVQLMNDAQRESFNKCVFEINECIKDTKRLNEKFEAYCRKRRKLSLMTFDPFNNKLIRRLQFSNILPVPTFVGLKMQKNIYDVINCESHRDVILAIFEKMFENIHEQRN